uniref:Homologous recombination factor with OB-fold n=1 Tax=Otolemur garnettii TaxID=30611 RepID=H0WVU8_OTOGA
QACSLQKLFTVEEEFEDEDFLSAVEDAENQFAGSLPVNARLLRTVSSRPQETVQEQSSRPLPLHPSALSEGSDLPALGLCLPVSSMTKATSHLPCTGIAPLSPVSTSSSWTGIQREATLTEVLREPARSQSSAPRSLVTFESQQQWVGGFEGPEQDEFDKVLASMELDGPNMELELGVSSEATRTLPAQQQRENPALAKKAQVVDLSGSCWKGPATHIAGIMSVQDKPLGPIVHCRTPQPCMRPGIMGNLPDPASSTIPPQQPHWEGCPQGPPIRAPQPLQVAGGPVQSSPQNQLPSRPFHSLSVWSSDSPHFPRLRTSNSCCSTTSRTSSGLFQPRHLELRAPVSSVESHLGTIKGLHSSLVPQGALQTPIVTNHLVQLVSAANRTPQQTTRPSTRAKARRFPGPAGILPHQHSGNNLEAIMVSTPQTPTHGALAKFRTEIVASSQASVEEDFARGPWLTMKSALGVDEKDPTCFLCTYSIVMVLRKQAALKQLPRNKVPNMAVMIKSLTRSTMDASVVFKDPTGEMQGTLHRLLLETRQNELKPGSVLLLKQNGLFVFCFSYIDSLKHYIPTELENQPKKDRDFGSIGIGNQILCPQDSGSFHDSLQHDVAAKPGESLRTAQNPEAGEELPEADDLDGLLSELPEDFFCGTNS